MKTTNSQMKPVNQRSNDQPKSQSVATTTPIHALNEIANNNTKNNSNLSINELSATPTTEIGKTSPVCNDYMKAAEAKNVVDLSKVCPDKKGRLVQHGLSVKCLLCNRVVHLRRLL